MKKEDNSNTVAYALAYQIDMKESDKPTALPRDNITMLEPHTKSPPTPIPGSSLRVFWITYSSLLLLSLINVLISTSTHSADFIFYIYGCSLVFLFLNSILVHRHPHRPYTSILFVASSVHFIITDPATYEHYSLSDTSALISLQLILPLSLLFSSILERRLCALLSLISSIASLAVLISNPNCLSRGLLQFFIIAVLILYSFFNAKSRISVVNPRDEQNITPLEEILAQLNSVVTVLDKHGDNCGSCKAALEFSTENVLNAISRLQTCKNIYSTRLEKITMHMDADDRVFIEQNAHESSSFNSLNISERIERRSRSESAVHLSKLGGLLKLIGRDWNFNTFFLRECTENSPLEVAGLYIVSRFRLDTVFALDSSRLELFLKDLEARYLPNPYHNSCHGADVMSSYLFFVTNSDLFPRCTDLELMAGILATLGHDVGHPAKNNRFLVITRDKIAIQYNDVSVLENLHCTVLFQLLQTSALLEALFQEQWVSFRKICIELILATDMSKHFDLVETFKTKYAGCADISRADIRLDLFKMIVKASDLGHAAKNIELHQKWCAQVIEEFYLQGDQEKVLGLPISMYCDREHTNIGKSQAGFIKNIVMPLYVCLNAVLGCALVETACIVQLGENKMYWESIVNLSRNQTFVDKIQVQDLVIRRRSSLPLKQ